MTERNLVEELCRIAAEARNSEKYDWARFIHEGVSYIQSLESQLEDCRKINEVLSSKE